VQSEPEPISGRYYLASNSWEVDWTLPLQTNPTLNADNWRMSVQHVNKMANSAAALGTLTYGTAVNFVQPRPNNTISYEPPPFDLASAGGTLLGAFSNIPLTVLP